MNPKNKNGFTLVEILIVAAIIGVLATIVFISLTSAQSKSRYSRVIADMETISKALKVYSIENNNIYPADAATGTLPAGMSSYFSNGWPKPPCGTYSYDYENLGLDTTKTTCTPPSPTSTDPYQAIGLLYRAFDSDIVSFYNVKDFQPCATAEVNIMTQADKAITCNE